MCDKHSQAFDSNNFGDHVVNSIIIGQSCSVCGARLSYVANSICPEGPFPGWPICTAVFNHDCTGKRKPENSQAFTDMLALANAVVAAHDSMFEQCLSNPINNAWGQPINLAKFNDAYCMARKIIVARKGMVE